MWCLPTHKRPEKLRRFVASMADDDRLEHVLLMVWRHDPRLRDYAGVFMDMPKTWDVWLTEERLCGEKLNLAFDRFPDEEFYGLLTDDIMLRTPGMLGELKMEAKLGRFAWPNDGIHGPRLATHPCAPGKMLKALGFWAHPLFPHNGLDTVLYRVSEAMGLSKYRADLHIETPHPNGVQHNPEWDETYAEAAELNAKAVDTMYAFQQRGLPELINQVRSVYEQRKVA